jgi:hypothetical protein
VYHKYKADEQSSTWVLISASTSAQLYLDRYIKSAGTENISTLNPFEIHLILLDTALSNWRLYVISITEKMSEQVGSGHYPL